jgi:hypothetical protein
VANNLSELQNSGDSVFQIVDNRPETLAQLKLKQAINLAPMGFTIKGHSAIQRVLEKCLYAGLIKVPDNRGKHVKASHAPIISKPDYWLAQEMLAGKTITGQKREEVPLRGVLHCTCGKK